MFRFIKNNLYGITHCLSTDGRDSRRTYCDIRSGLMMLVLAGVCFCIWRNALGVMFLREFLAISDTACWVLCGMFGLWLIVTFACAAARRWHDLDIKIPRGESVWSLIPRLRFWQVLSHEEGGQEKNQYGPAPADNPAPLVDSKDVQEAIRSKLFAELDDIEEIK